MKVRQNYQPYLDRIEKYFRQLLPQVQDLQFTQGGPIIGFQVGPNSSCHFFKLQNYFQMLNYNTIIN